MIVRRSATALSIAAVLSIAVSLPIAAASSPMPAATPAATSGVETPYPTTDQLRPQSLSECVDAAPDVSGLFPAPVDIEDWLPPRLLGEDQTAFVVEGTDMSDPSLDTTRLVQELGARGRDLEIAVWWSSTGSFPEQAAIRVAGATGIDLLAPWSRIMAPLAALRASTDELLCRWGPQPGGPVLRVTGGMHDVAAVPLDEGLIILRTLIGQPIDSLVDGVLAYYEETPLEGSEAAVSVQSGRAEG